MAESTRRVVELTYYPIKSCAGVHSDRLDVGSRGFLYDRDWLVVDSKNEALTQREYPKMAMIKAAVSNNGSFSHTGNGEPVGGMLELNAPSMPPLHVDVLRESGKEELPVTVWKADCFAFDQGDAASKWLSTYLDAEVRLLRVSEQPDHGRTVKVKGEFKGEKQVAFADMFPFQLISAASLEELNRRLEKPLAMNRFRPSIVIDGCEPFEEDRWREIRVGSIRMIIDSPCARCVLTTIDQESGEKGVEPLRELSKFRKEEDGNKTLFGQYAIHLENGAIACGDELVVESWKE